MKNNNSTDTDNTISEPAKNIVASTLASIRDAVDLAMLEAKLAQYSLLMILKLGIVIGTLSLITWILFLSAIFFWLSSQELSNMEIFLILAGINGLLIIPLLLMKQGYTKNLEFNGTKKLLKRGHEENDNALKRTN